MMSRVIQLVASTGRVVGGRRGFQITPVKTLLPAYSKAVTHPVRPGFGQASLLSFSTLQIPPVSTRIRSILGNPDGLAGQNIRVSGSVRLGDEAHLEVNDGSCSSNLLVRGSALSNLEIATGTSVSLEGQLTAHGKRKIELNVEEREKVIIGPLDLPVEPQHRLMEVPQLYQRMRSMGPNGWTLLVTMEEGEQWKIEEANVPFLGLEGTMNFAEELLKSQCNHLLRESYEDLETMFYETCIDMLKVAASAPFGRVTYTEAIKLLEEAVAQGKKFEKQVEWGIDLASEHERYLTDVLFQKPLIVYNYPKEIKAFYMRLNDDGKTVAAFDVLVPMAGKITSGWEREEHASVITRRIVEMGLPIEPYDWYVELRRHGTLKHCGLDVDNEGLLRLCYRI